MTACTDDERRLVAERLRGLNGNVSHVRSVYEDEGFSILCDDQADYYQICHAVAGYLPAEHMHPCDYKELHDCLADLIDPDCEDGRYEGVRTARPVDREALLALAGHMETYGLGECMAVSMQVALDEYARRIRECCGEAS